MTDPRYRFGLATAVVLVALRFAVGWHFFEEGAEKYKSGDFSSAGFLSSASGPLAPTYKMMVWDADGRARLNLDETRQAWSLYRERIVNHYGFDEEQRKAAEEAWRHRDRQLRTFFETNAADIDEYMKGLSRVAENDDDPARQYVPSLRGQSQKIEGELASDRVKWMATLDQLREDYERDMNEIATEEQRDAAGRFALAKQGRRWLDSEAIDQVIPYFDMAVGALLIVGLFTRLTAIAGAAFLASIIASQWPGSPGAVPIHNQLIEMLALLTLAALAAGRFAGLDYFLYAARMRFFPPSGESSAAASQTT